MKSGFTFASAIAIATFELSASAQDRTGFALARFEPSERGGRLFVVDTLAMRGHAVGATMDYGYKPLVVTSPAGDERRALVLHQLELHAGGAIVLVRGLRLGVDVPFALYQDGEGGVVRGESVKSASDPAIGDVRLAIDARVVHRVPLSLAVGVRAWLPTGSRAEYTSDGSLRVAPQILAGGQLGLFSWGARVAFVFRARDDRFVNVPLGSELTGALGGGIHVGRATIGPELFAAARTAGGLAPIDGILGAHLDLTENLRLALGAGTGLTRGLGAPRFRGLAAIEWVAPEPIPDRDRDGVPDPSDACPDRAGVRSGDPEQNGCPEPAPLEREDADGDGVADVDDACPTLPGPRSVDPRTNGCPTLAVVTESEIAIKQQIRFATASADLVSPSDEILGAVKRLLDDHPDLTKVRVEGHTDDVGDETFNDDLSARRAAAVVAWLVAHGLEPARLTSAGYGRRQPIDTNATEAGRANNRRVVFKIVR